IVDKILVTTSEPSSLLIPLQAPMSNLSPYTTLFRSGIGNTPLIGMLGHLAETGSTRQVVVVHGDRSQRTHALRSELERFAAKLRSEEHTSELQSRENIVCRLLLEKKNRINPAFNSIF